MDSPGVPSAVRVCRGGLLRTGAGGQPRRLRARHVGLQRQQQRRRAHEQRLQRAGGAARSPRRETPRSCGGRQRNDSAMQPAHCGRTTTQRVCKRRRTERGADGGIVLRRSRRSRQRCRLRVAAARGLERRRRGQHGSRHRQRQHILRARACAAVSARRQLRSALGAPPRRTWYRPCSMSSTAAAAASSSVRSARETQRQAAKRAWQAHRPAPPLRLLRRRTRAAAPSAWRTAGATPARARWAASRPSKRPGGGERADLRKKHSLTRCLHLLPEAHHSETAEGTSAQASRCMYRASVLLCHRRHAASCSSSAFASGDSVRRNYGTLREVQDAQRAPDAVLRRRSARVDPEHSW